MGLMEKLRNGLVVAGTLGSLLLACKDKSVVGPPPTEQPPTQQPTPNRAPVITSSPVLQCNENTEYIYDVVKTDPDGDQTTLSLPEKPSWLSVSNTRVSGPCPEVLQDTPTPTRLRVTDSKGAFTDQFWSLTNKNVSNTYVLTQSQASTITSLQDNSIAFSSPIIYTTGDFVSSDITNQTPNGILREITGISADKKTIQTTQPSIEEVVKNGSFDFQGKISPSGAIMVPSLLGVSAAPAAPNFDFGISLKDVPIYDRDENPNTLGDRVLANGSISFNTNFSLKGNIENIVMKQLSFKNNTTEELDVTLTSNSTGITAFKEVKIAEYNLPSFVLGYIPLGIILLPIIVSPKIEAILAINPTLVNPLGVNVKQTATLSAGISYNGFWDWESNLSNSFTFSNPIFSNQWTLKASVGPKLSLLVFKSLGPVAGVNGTMRFDASSSGCKLYGGLEAVLGVSMEIFSKKIAAYAKKVADTEKLLFECASNPTPTGDILFTSTRDGNGEIYIMGADGLNPQNLTKNSSHDYESSWSPDRKKFAFVSERDGNSEIYAMDLNGSNLKRLTQSTGSSNNVDRMPSWSSDGQEIVFASDRNNNKELFLMNADGSNQRKLNIPFGSHAHPRWCGNQIVFSSTLSGNGSFDIHKVNPDGTGLQRLTTSTFADVEPSCSPDGTKIAFSSNRTTGTYYDIWTMSADGTNQVNRSNTTIGIDDYLPSWSPDGLKIAYTFGNINGNSSDIYTMNADGTNKVRITTRATGTTNLNPFWK